MFKLSQIVNQNFLSSFVSFGQIEMTASLSYQVSGVYSRVMEEVKKYNDILMSTAKKYCILDESGNAKIDKNGNFEAENSEKEKSLQSEINDLRQTDVDLPLIPLSLILDSGMKVSPKILSDIDFIIAK